LQALVALEPLLNRGPETCLRPVTGGRRQSQTWARCQAALSGAYRQRDHRWRGGSQQWHVDEWHANLERVRHAGPIGIAKKLISHIK
jgi:hypothetical protein